MELISKSHRVFRIKKKTKATFFKDLAVGDTIWVTFDLCMPGRNGNSLYASYLTVVNITKNTSHSDSITMISKHLGYFDLRE